MAANTNVELKNVKVNARPSNYGVNHISIGIIDGNNNSTLPSGDFTYLVLARNYKGYAYTSVATITAATAAGGVMTFTTDGIPHKLEVGNNVFITGITPSSLNLGYSIVSSVPTATGFSVITTAVATYSSGGTAFSISPAAEVLNVWTTPTSSSVPTTTTILGISAPYHYFDTGSSATSTTINPGKGVIGTSTQGKEAYYSTFMYDITYGWRRIQDFSQLFVKDYGVTNTTTGQQIFISTIDQMLSYLPEFYKRDITGGYNADLENFLKLFAFQYDTWRTYADRVFDSTSVDLVDEKLVNLYVKEFGFPVEQLDDTKKARRAMESLIRAYLLKGSNKGLQLISNIISGYYTTVSTASSDINLIPDQNSATFNEPGGFDMWTIDATSPTNNPGVAHQNTSLRLLGTPALFNVGSPYTSYSARTVNITSTSDNGILALIVDSASPSASGVVRIISSPRTGNLNSDGTGSTLFAQYADVRAGDYLIPTSTAQALTIPYGTYVTLVQTQTASSIKIVVSTGVTATAGQSFQLSAAGPDMVAAASKMIPITANNPYAFSLYANAGGMNPSPITPFIEWYKLNGTRSTATGNIITTGPTLAVAVTATTSWNRATVVGTAPADAFYAAPGWTVVRTAVVASQVSYFFDAIQFEAGNTTTAFVRPSRVLVTTQSSTYSPLNSSVNNRLTYLLKDYTTSSFLPLNAVSTSYTALKVSDVSISLTASSPLMGYDVAYPMATITLQTGTSNILPGMSFSISNTSLSATNQVQFGLILGVISSTQYRVIKRSVFSTDPVNFVEIINTAGSPNIQNNMYVNTPNIPTLYTL